MHIADGMINVNEEDLAFARQIGVTHLVTRPSCPPEQGYYDYESLIQLRTRVEASGLQVAAIHDVPSSWNDKIRRGLPGRDEQLDNYCRSVENIGRAGIPILGYSFHAFQVWRTTRYAPGLGGATFTGYDHALMRNAPPLASPPLTDEEMWEAFRYFARRVIPVAEAAGVKMALHPDDPPISPIAGAACIFRSVEAFQRALDMVPSPANGLLFCQGCYTEMLGQGVYDAIRHFGSQGKVWYVHFRNVVGQLPAFREAFIDHGDIDMLKAMQLWKEVGYDGPMMPDHYGHIVGDSDYGHRAHAHAIGYMKALMQAVGALDEG
jgi:mannonate dehydratase